MRSIPYKAVLVILYCIMNQPKTEQLKTMNIHYPTQFLRIRNPEVAWLSALAQRLSWACSQVVRAVVSEGLAGEED